MPEHVITSVSDHLSESPPDQLPEEYKRQQTLFNAQPSIVQRFLETQARQVAEAYIERVPHVRFALPDRIACEPIRGAAPLPVASSLREQTVGGFRDRLAGRDVHNTLRQRLAELEQSPERAVVIGAGLIRYAAAIHMIHNMLPAGRSVTYAAAEDEEIPTIPIGRELEPESAITAKTDVIVEEGKVETDRGELVVPYVPAARRFYLPQWVAFDDKDRLLVKSVSEAEAHVASMQRFLTVVFAARTLAPYVVADEEFQKKRYGMLGQLVNQGRALARHQTREIIIAIKQRSVAQSLNRGLSLSIPYFDDQDLVMKMRHFMVIPAGRIMFVPAFVVRAAQEEQAKVSQDTRLSPSTRKHMLVELHILRDSFITSSK